MHVPKMLDARLRQTADYERQQRCRNVHHEAWYIEALFLANFAFPQCIALLELVTLFGGAVITFI